MHPEVSECYPVILQQRIAFLDNYNLRPLARLTLSVAADWISA